MRIRAHKAKLQFLTSSIRKIPDEILSSIFNYVCEWNLFQEFPWTSRQWQKPTKLTAPIISYLPALSLSATCIRWRSVAKSSPNLWSKIKLELGSGEATDTSMLDAFIALVNLFLARSGCNPLDIHLYIHGEPKLPIHPVLRLIVQQCSRWIYFYYHGKHIISEHLRAALEGASFPLLKSLEFIDSRLGIDDLNIFTKSPKLESLQLYDLAQSQIPWTQLNNLYVCATYGQVDRILDRCPNLSSVIFHDQDSPNAFGCTPPRTSESIKNLDVIDRCGGPRDPPRDILKMIFSSFTFPALHNLLITAVQGHRYDREWPIDAFGPFVSRSSCKITTLSIIGVRFPDADLVSALQLLPSLVTLEISPCTDRYESSSVTPALISHLRSRQNTALSEGSTPETISMPLIPKLRYLILETDCIYFDDDAFISMVSSRWNPHHPLSADSSSMAEGVDCLRSVVMDFKKRQVDKIVYSPLRELDRAGLRVVVYDMSGIIV